MTILAAPIAIKIIKASQRQAHTLHRSRLLIGLRRNTHVRGPRLILVWPLVEHRRHHHHHSQTIPNMYILERYREIIDSIHWPSTHTHCNCGGFGRMHSFGERGGGYGHVSGPLEHEF